MDTIYQKSDLPRLHVHFSCCDRNSINTGNYCYVCVTMCAADPHTLWFPLKLVIILRCKKMSILKCLWMKSFKTFKHCKRHRCNPCSILIPLHNCTYIFYFHYYILFSILEGSTCCAANLTAWALTLLVADVLVTNFSSCNSTQQQFMLAFAISRNEAWCKQKIWGFCGDWSDEWIFTKCILWYYTPLNYPCK